MTSRARRAALEWGIQGALAVSVLLPAAVLLPALLGLRAHLGLLHPLTATALIAVLAPTAWAAAAALRSTPVQARRRLANAAAALVSTIASLVALEGAVRILGLDPIHRESWRRQVGESPLSSPSPERPTYALKPGATWSHRYSSNDRGYFDADDSISYRTNSEGWRGSEFIEARDPRVARIAFLGDSFGFGEGVREEDTVAGRLPRLLSEDRGCAAEVYNFSVPGYATSNEATILESIVPRYHPDLVVVWFFLNDIEGTPATMTILGGKDDVELFSWARPFSAIARLVDARLDRYVMSEELIRSYTNAYRSDRPPVAKLRRQLGRLAAWSRATGVPVVLFIHPILFRLDSTYPFAAAHETVASIGRDLGLPVRDLFDVFRGRPAESLWVHAADQHPNEVAHAISARYAARELEPYLGACAR